MKILKSQVLTKSCLPSKIGTSTTEKISSLECEIDEELMKLAKREEMIFNAQEKERLEKIIYDNIKLNRRIRSALIGKINFVELGFDLVTSPQDCIEVYSLVFKMYQNRGYNTLTKFGGEDAKSRPTIPGLNYDNNDSRSVTAVTKKKGKIVGTARIILDSPGIFLPAEKLYNPYVGFKKLRLKYLKRGEIIGEISKVANSKPGTQWKALMKFWHILSKPLKIGNQIAITAKEDYNKIHSKFGFQIQLEKRFYEEIGTDVIITWDQNEEITPYYRKMILGERMAILH